MTEESRFDQYGYQEMYDLEYSSIKHSFDQVNLKRKSAVKKLNSLAGQTHHLTRKYVSINDEDGANQCSRLHNEIEETLEGLIPVFENRLRRRITIGMIVLCSGLGFWKGDYVKDQAKKVVESYHRIANDKSSEGLNELETMLEEDVSSAEEKEEVILKPKSGSLPHGLAYAAEIYPDSKYGILVEQGKMEAEVYNIEDFSLMKEFPLTISRYDAVTGHYKVSSYSLNNTPLYGSVKFELESENGNRLYLSGTYSQNLIGAIRTKTRVSNNIYVMDSTIIDLYYLLKPSFEKTLVVVQ